MADYALSFPATFEAYARASGDLRRALEANSVPAKRCYSVELVFEEIVSNIIRHARSDRPQCAVEVSVRFGPDAVVMSFRDDGEPFDPCAHQIPEVSLTLDDARDGGLGLMLVHKSADRMEYQRTPQHRNHLTITITA